VFPEVSKVISSLYPSIGEDYRSIEIDLKEYLNPKIQKCDGFFGGPNEPLDFKTKEISKTRSSFETAQYLIEKIVRPSYEFIIKKFSSLEKTYNYLSDEKSFPITQNSPIRSKFTSFFPRQFEVLFVLEAITGNRLDRSYEKRLMIWINSKIENDVNDNYKLLRKILRWRGQK
jgi:hypothetical protein